MIHLGGSRGFLEKVISAPNNLKDQSLLSVTLIREGAQRISGNGNNVQKDIELNRIRI